MHEYHGAVEIIEHAAAHCEERGHSKVTKIQLVIGESSGYSFEVVKGYFEEASVGTVCEGAEVTVPGLYDFLLYCIHNMVMDYKLYKRGKLTYPLVKFIDDFLIKTQSELCDLIKTHGRFKAPTLFTDTLSLGEGYINHGCKMGEGWLLTSEMLELGHSGVKNIVCTQPFGCLPNHICGKGMMKPIKDKNPDINIVAIDYDASASRVNQENRIKLMLSTAKDKLEKELIVK